MKIKIISKTDTTKPLVLAGAWIGRTDGRNDLLVKGGK